MNMPIALNTTCAKQKRLDMELIEAIHCNNPANKIQSLLDIGANPNSIDITEDGVPALTIAVYNRNIELVKTLIEAGADPNTQDEYGYTVLYEAVTDSDFEMVVFLIKHGANPHTEENHFSPIMLKPEYFSDEVIFTIFKNAIEQNDLQTIINLSKHFNEFNVDALSYATTQNKIEIIDYLMSQNIITRKISQYQLNKLIIKNFINPNIILRDLLKDNNYKTDLSYLSIDGSKLFGVQLLDLAELTLCNSKLHRLSATKISFIGSDLTNTNITFRNQAAIVDFSNSNLTRSFIYGLESQKANFNDAIIEHSFIEMIINGSNNLTQAQQAQIINLNIAKEFSQDSLQSEHIEYNNEGICLGLVVDFAQYTLISLDKGEGYGNYLSNLKNKIKNSEPNFIPRILLYQENLQSHLNDIEINATSIRDHEFIESLPSEVKLSNILGCSISTEFRYHILAVIKLRDPNKNIIGYKIFDPNFGDIFCKNELEINQQVNLLFQNYQRDNTHNKSIFKVMALDELVIKHKLIQIPHNTKISKTKLLNKITHPLFSLFNKF